MCNNSGNARVAGAQFNNSTCSGIIFEEDGKKAEKIAE